MSDEPVVNGGAAVDVDVEIDSEKSPNEAVEILMKKLEQENKQSAEKIKQLEDEIQSSESDKRALSSIAARAAELETDVLRLQHDLISSMSEAQESNAELAGLKLVVEDLKTSEFEKSQKIDAIEKERNLLLDRLSDSEVKLIESDYQIQQFETKTQGFEVKLSEKDEEIKILNRKVDEFESVIENLNMDKDDLQNHLEGKLKISETKVNELELKIEELQQKLELKKEKDELQNDLEAKLKISETKVNELESEIRELQQKLELSEKGYSDLKEKEVEKVSNSKVDWPVVAATAGAVAMVAVVYFRHAKF